MATVIGFAGFSNSGKTRLISRLVCHYAQLNIRCAVIKHDAHGHYKEAAGSDSSQFAAAGAAATVLISPDSYVAFRRTPVSLETLLAGLQTEGYDLILVEGFKQGTHEQIALFRDPQQANILSELLQAPMALVAPISLKSYRIEGVPWFDPDDLPAIADWIAARM